MLFTLGKIAQHHRTDAHPHDHLPPKRLQGWLLIYGAQPIGSTAGQRRLKLCGRLSKERPTGVETT